MEKCTFTVTFSDGTTEEKTIQYRGGRKKALNNAIREIEEQNPERELVSMMVIDETKQ